MRDRGHPGTRLSLIVWLNLVRFVTDEGVSIRDVASAACADRRRIDLMLGCLERWGVVTLGPAADHRGIRERRVGWGSGRGLRAEWIVRLTGRGRDARDVWMPLVGEIEQRWQARFGGEPVRLLREGLAAIAARIEWELPDGLPDPSMFDAPIGFAARTPADAGALPIAALLSRVLLAFALEFNRESDASLPMAATVLRAIGEAGDTGVRVGDLPVLAGGSPETTAIGWRLARYVTLEAVRPRGKVARLNPRGVIAIQRYVPLVQAIEERWEQRYGAGPLRVTRSALITLLNATDKDGPTFSRGLVPPEGVARAGDELPALGRRDVGAAARQRTRDLAAQTHAFIADPAGALPHYPLWDMNRGFGP